MRRPNSGDKKYRTRTGWNQAKFDADMRDWQSQEDAKAASWNRQSNSTLVKSSVNRDSGQPQTELLHIDRSSSSGDHGHTAISDTGDTTYHRP